MTMESSEGGGACKAEEAAEQRRERQRLEKLLRMWEVVVFELSSCVLCDLHLIHTVAELLPRNV